MISQTPTYFPSWLPTSGARPWRLVDTHTGSFYPRPAKDAPSETFATAEAAIAFARARGIPLDVDIA